MSTENEQSKINKPEEKTVHCDNCGETYHGVCSSLKAGRQVSEKTEYWSNSQSSGSTKTTTYTDFVSVPVALCMNCLQASFANKLKMDRRNAKIYMAISGAIILFSFTDLGSLWFLTLISGLVFLNHFANWRNARASAESRIGQLLKGEPMDFEWYEGTLMKGFAQEKIKSTGHTHVFTSDEFAKLKRV